MHLEDEEEEISDSDAEDVCSGDDPEDEGEDQDGSNSVGEDLESEEGSVLSA